MAWSVAQFIVLPLVAALDTRGGWTPASHVTVHLAGAHSKTACGTPS